MTPAAPEILTAREACALLRVSWPTLRDDARIPEAWKGSLLGHGPKNVTQAYGWQESERILNEAEAALLRVIGAFPDRVAQGSTPGLFQDETGHPGMSGPAGKPASSGGATVDTGVDSLGESATIRDVPSTIVQPFPTTTDGKRSSPPTHPGGEQTTKCNE